MPRFGMGITSGGKGVVKIMADNADDPRTTANSETGKFRFNSEQPGNSIGFILDIIVVEPDFVAYPPGGVPTNPNRYFLPAGSNENNCEILIRCHSFSGNTFQTWQFYLPYFQNKYGITYMPLCEVRTPTDYVNKKTFDGPRLDLTYVHAGTSGNIDSYAACQALWYTVVDSGYNGGAGRNRPAISVAMTSSGAVSPISRGLMTVFALPMNDAAIPDYSGAPVSGQEVVRIDKDSGGIARVALPGYTVYELDTKRFLLHEDRIPAKILGAGEIAVASGGTAVITTRFSLPLTTYMDYIVRRAGSTATEKFQYWHPPYIESINLNQECGFTYVVSGNTITITSTADMDIVIRYMICANTGNTHTTGGKKILLMGNDGVGDYVQVKRPGSSDVAPNLDDIMVDTRLSYIPLLAEGFLNYNSTDMPDTPGSGQRFKGERKRSLVIPNPNGLLLFPKLGAIYNETSVAPDYDEPLAIWNRHGVAINAGSDSGKCAGGSVWSNIIDETHLDIWSGGDNPWTWVTTQTYDNTTKGVRYYVFGIPPSL
ncbi:hypothetical protein NKJ71_13875 [Mesorhizobium sp. M0050]|uniref:hypothetical protein n=1 Tax=Mesorhizobium sp. M0050 TaxID=2956861 RepID=UPI003339DC3A